MVIKYDLFLFARFGRSVINNRDQYIEAIKHIKQGKKYIKRFRTVAIKYKWYTYEEQLNNSYRHKIKHVLNCFVGIDLALVGCFKSFIDVD